MSAVRFAPETFMVWAGEGKPEQAAKVLMVPLVVILGTEAETTPTLKL